MTNGEYIKNRISDRDIMMVMMDGNFTDFGIWDEAWTVFNFGWLKQQRVSKEQERKLWLRWLSLQYNEKMWKEIIAKLKD